MIARPVENSIEDSGVIEVLSIEMLDNFLPAGCDQLMTKVLNRSLEGDGIGAVHSRVHLWTVSSVRLAETDAVKRGTVRAIQGRTPAAEEGMPGNLNRWGKWPGPGRIKSGNIDGVT